MSSPWVLPNATRAAGRIRLWCLPYAGGGASVYHGWAEALAPVAEVRAVQLPGRENRLREPAVTDWRDLVSTLAQAIGPELDPPYAVFGHSFGGLLAFELARQLRWEGYDPPCVLMVAGCNPPDKPKRRQPPMYMMPDDRLVDELMQLGGTPPGVLENAELRSLLLPVIRADFQLCETHRFSPAAPLASPIVAYSGLGDAEAPPANIAGWSNHTSSGYRQVDLPGGHFFLRTQRDVLLADVRQELERRCD